MRTSARPFVHASALVEREDALAVLDAALRTAGDGQGRLVLVRGEAGVGKTSLVRRFCELHRESTRQLVGTCDALFTPRPLGPIVEVAESVGGELRAAVDRESRHHEIASALVRELGARTILVLEDLHWADEATLDVLRLLGRRMAEVRGLVVATYRDDQLDAGHPLRIVLGELTATAVVDRVALPPLSPAAVARLAAPYDVDEVELYRLTGGNPFFVTEVLLSREEHIPATVRDAVLARAARLTPSARRLLELVAIAAHPQIEISLLEAEASLADLDECLASGMLVSTAGSVAFRHELARLSVEESVMPGRARELHRTVLAGLRVAARGPTDLARLAHHAEGADDADAVLELARAAGDHAASLGAHREAAEQYARALRFATGVPPAELAALLRLRSQECYLTDQADEAIDALRQAVERYREAGDGVREGATLARLAAILWCPGRGREGMRPASEAVTLLERLPPGPELGAAYTTLAFLCRTSSDMEGARTWDDRALALARRLRDEHLLARVLVSSGYREILGDHDVGRRALERAARLAHEQGDEELVAEALLGLAAGALFWRAYDVADQRLVEALAHAVEHGNDLQRLYVLATRAVAALERARWQDAAESAALVLRERAISTFPRTQALVVLALVRARRGDPDVAPLLDEAAALAHPTGELGRIAPVAAARAEVAWLRGERDDVRSVTDEALRLARDAGAARLVAELVVWRRRAGFGDEADEPADTPDALTLMGEHALAASAWAELGCPDPAALALLDAGDEPALRRALAELNALEARPVAALVARKLREQGARDVPRGPRRSTAANTAQLTVRELEVLGLVAEGLRNADIAERLFVSPRTVDHHVSAIRRKLGARTRGEAVAAAARLGLLEDR